MATSRRYETAKGLMWEVAYVKPDGRTTRKRGFKTKRDADAWSAENTVALNKTGYLTQTQLKQKLAPFIEEYLAKEASLSPTTIANRRSVGAKWVTPYWAETTLRAVDAAAVESWVEQIHADGAGAQTIRKAHQILSGVMSLCVKRKLLSANPARGVTLPRITSREHGYLSAQQVSALVEASPSRDRLLLATLAYTGLRFGEAAALRVRDLKLANGTLRVSRSVTEVRGELVFGPPKNGRARDVPVVAHLIPALRAHVRGRGADDLVFKAPEGGTLRLTTWRRRQFQPAVKRAAAAWTERDHHDEVTFPVVTPHDLRHTTASLAVASGASVKVLQRMLGHTKASVTLDTYAGLFVSELDEVGSRLDQLAATTGIAGLL